MTDNAVLQQGVPLPVWGTTTARENVSVRFAGQTKTARATDDGAWRVELSPLKADGTGATMVVESGEDRQEFRNLLVGEVWYASGQSNMQMTLDACARKLPAIGESVDAGPTDHLRWLRIDEPDSPQPLARRQTATPWQLDHPDNRRKVSAVAYFFARELHKTLDVPIGIIEGSWGGKPIEGFIPRFQFEQQEPLRAILSLAEQDRLGALAALEGGVVVRNTAGMPGRIFNARVAPITPYAVRGFLWYQGESNAGRGEDPRHYRIKMRALVEGWRQAWGQPELPIYFVQLPAFNNEATGWVRLREEQRRSLDIKQTGMAVAIDLRDDDIHPANKLDVGKRLANWALAKTYGKNIPFSGPLFLSANGDGDSMRVQFEHADSGLMVARKEGIAAPKPTPDTPLAHFELADQDGNWYPAQAMIEGAEVVVRNPRVRDPQAVRYACSGAPQNANLYSRTGLPASPFCSDLQLLPWESQK
ncbi:sialate O-acetylesterase [Rhodopirellula sp. JC639]|uniref:sialate O-acetylesterase n=1 Tax=Stieleria mannarensis TaxID=2755585 RepID=UPI0016025B47|nr:sialate O-acetylesterase [Rhodopirellula sp. JC639]